MSSPAIRITINSTMAPTIKTLSTMTQPVGTFFMIATIGIIIAMLVNVFLVQSSMMSLIVSCVTVLLFAGITAYETQLIKEMYVEGDGSAAARSKSIFGAFMLYGSFVTLFIHILNILGIMRSE